MLFMAALLQGMYTPVMELRGCPEMEKAYALLDRAKWHLDKARFCGDSEYEFFSHVVDIVSNIKSSHIF